MTSQGPLPDVKMTPTSFQRSHVVTDPDGELAGLVFVLDFQEQNPAVARLRDWTMARLDPQPGETAVDVGCGTGAEVRRFADLVGHEGRALGVEPHAGLRSVAEERALGTTATFIDGDALTLPFEDGSVDVLRCERVWQHLQDAPQAAREVARVLARGGRAVIVDSDWGTTVTTPSDPDVMRRYNESAWSRMANPFAGRHLRGQLHAAGLAVDADIGSAALVMPDDLTRDPVIFRTNAALAVEDGSLTPEEVEATVASMAAAADRGEAFVAVTMFAVLARR